MQAVGGNRDMAQMSGLNVRRLTLLVWLLAGIAAGLAILPLLSQGSGSSSGTATPLLLETVLATFIGAAFSRRRVVTIWGRCWGQFWSTPSLTGSACWESISSGWAPLKAA